MLKPVLYSTNLEVSQSKVLQDLHNYANSTEAYDKEFQEIRQNSIQKALMIVQTLALGGTVFYFLGFVNFDRYAKILEEEESSQELKKMSTEEEKVHF